MKTLNSLILLFILSLSSFAFSQNKPFKPKKGMIKINVLQPSMIIEVGKKLYYTASTHGSVGTQVKAWSENDSIINLKDTHFTYDNKKKSKMSGGDAGKQTYIFEALKAGKSTVIIEESFRGEVKKTYKIEVLVKTDGEKNEEEFVKTELPKTAVDTIKISPIKGNVTIKLGQKISYSANVHGSVGRAVKVTSGNTEVIEKLNSKLEYKNKQEPMNIGGDAATRTYIFDSKKVGQSTITIQNVFRGTVENEYTIVVTVIE